MHQGTELYPPTELFVRPCGSHLCTWIAKDPNPIQNITRRESDPMRVATLPFHRANSALPSSKSGPAGQD